MSLFYGSLCISQSVANELLKTIVRRYFSPETIIWAGQCVCKASLTTSLIHGFLLNTVTLPLTL